MQQEMQDFLVEGLGRGSVAEGVRIDVISGLPGAGKTTFINMLLSSAPEHLSVAVCNVKPFSAGLAYGLSRNRPKRILLEAPGGMTLNEAVDRALNDKALWPSFPGARVAVLEAARFGRFTQEKARIKAASHVFLDGTAGLACEEQARLLKEIWGVNPRVNILVEPLDGLNLWRLLDIIPQ
jgi:hypothetical protein